MAYVLKHQHAGKLADYIFLDLPTDEQTRVVGEYANSVWGDGWIIPFEISIIEGDTYPNLPDYGTGPSNKETTGDVVSPKVVIGGVGGVENLPDFVAPEQG